MDAHDLEDVFDLGEEELDQMAGPFEQGEWPEGATRPIGRPRLPEDETRLVTVRMPASEVEAIDRHAKARGTSRSQFIGDACLRAGSSLL